MKRQESSPHLRSCFVQQLQEMNDDYYLRTVRGDSVADLRERLRASPSYFHSENGVGENMLMYACRHGATKCVEFLRDYWVETSISKADCYGRTVLHYAALKDTTAIVPLLLEQPGIEASWTIRTTSQDSGDGRYSNHGATPLTFCCGLGSYNTALALLSSGHFRPTEAIINDADSEGCTSLWHVCVREPGSAA
jgi:ankyrin repeat protein